MDEKIPPRDKPAEIRDTDAFPTPAQLRINRFEKRRNKIVSEIQRNRRGEYTVPTWVLTGLLVLIIVSFAAIIIFAG